ncbi:hypothetical protein ACFL21_02415 [Patescibacteria group bacterium]
MKALIGTIIAITAIFTIAACCDDDNNRIPVRYDDPGYPHERMVLVGDATEAFTLEIQDERGYTLHTIDRGREVGLTVLPYADNCVDVFIHAHWGTTFTITVNETFWLWDGVRQRYDHYYPRDLVRVSAQPGTSDTAICFD